LVADTKLDLVVNPVGFLVRALHAWDPTAGFGQLQNQAQGYLFPVGPVFALTHAAGLPMWMVQRLWIGVILTIACAGTVRLADELEIGTPATRVAGGLAYALSPSLLSLIGPLSALVLPAAMAPWALVPLVRGSRRGSPVRAAARSGVAIALMGAVNAGATLAMLSLPALWLLTRQRGPRRRALVGWWVVSVTLACAWWTVSLVAEGRFVFDFLRYIEVGRAVTATASATEALRGTAVWLGHYLFQGRPWWRGAWLLVAAPAAIVASTALVATGLAALSHHRMPERRFLALAVLAGLALTAAGYAGPLGGPLAPTVHSLLDGPLVVFRSIAKFGPLVALPVALGLAYGLAIPRPDGVERVLLAGLVALLFIGLAMPLLQRQVTPAGSFDRVPAYWSQAAGWLDTHSGGSRSLLVPASGAGEYSWGRPIDEPLQPLADSPWAVRNQAPLGATGLVRVLDAVEERLVSGRATAGLAPFIARAGVRYLVVRNDLDWRRAAAPDPSHVRATLSAAPGLRRVTAFGPQQAGPVAAGDDPLRAVEIYEVADAGARAVAYPADTTVVVSGGPEALLQMADRERLGAATVLAGDDSARAAAPVASVVTDGLRRRDVDFGVIHGGRSYVLGDTEDGRDGPPRDRLPVEGVQHQTVAVVEGAAAVFASSYATALSPHPENQPMAAFDGDPSTAWQSGALVSSVGEWVQVDLDRAVTLPKGLTVQLAATGTSGPRATRLRVSTDRGSIDTEVADTTDPQHVDAPTGPTRRVRITLANVEGETSPLSLARAGLSEVQVPGVDIRRLLATPRDEVAPFAAPTSPPPVFAFDRSVVDPSEVLRGDEEDRLARRFTVPHAATFELSGTVRPHPGPDLEALLAPYGQGDGAKGTFTLPCGQGPVVHIDGKEVPTSVTGRLDAARAGQELAVSACGGAFDLVGGPHDLETDPGGALAVVSATLAPPGSPAPVAGAATGRAVTIDDWDSNHRSLRIAAGDRSFLTLTESANAGWTASLGGHRLQPVRIDGWRQAWVVPAGAGGVVHLDFQPDRPYRGALALGFLALIALGLLAWAPKPRWVARRGAVAADLAPVGPGSQAVLTIVLVGAALFVVAGPVALVVPAVLVFIRRPAWRPAVAASAFLVAGLIEAVHPSRQPGSGGGAFGAAGQLAAVVAAGAVGAAAIAAGLARRGSAGGSGRGDEDGRDPGSAGQEAVEGPAAAGDVVVAGAGQRHRREAVGDEDLGEGASGEQPQVAHDLAPGTAEHAQAADLGEHRLDPG
jgi:arabinofuranan 3-O-arabinosyltransferase